jgi:hypothetical protein
VRIARGDLESKYRRVELLFQALEDYFKLRGLWYRGPKAGLPWLARHDPESHTAFARALEPHAPLEDLRALAACRTEVYSMIANGIFVGANVHRTRDRAQSALLRSPIELASRCLGCF